MWLIWVILLVQVIGLAVYLGMALLPVTWLCEVAAYTAAAAAGCRALPLLTKGLSQMTSSHRLCSEEPRRGGL